jgi:uncharacterized OsmC-like protein
MSEQTAEKMTHTMVNGVDVDSLFGTIDAIKDDPAIAKFNFRIRNKWFDGGENHSTITDFYGAKEDHPHLEPFELIADEPPLLLSGDKGPNPVEYALTALAGCLTSSLIYHAAAKGIAIKGVESRLETELDLRGFLGISEDVKVGYKHIHVYFKIDADVSDEEKDELIKMAQKYSPTFNTISNATPVTAQLEK